VLWPKVVAWVENLINTSSNHRLESAGLNALEELLFKMLGIEKMVASERRRISGSRLSTEEAVTAGLRPCLESVTENLRYLVNS